MTYVRRATFHEVKKIEKKSFKRVSVFFLLLIKFFVANMKTATKKVTLPNPIPVPTPKYETFLMD